jgi:3'(2'), 5'-bisphosphate nucleotidase
MDDGLVKVCIKAALDAGMEILRIYNQSQDMEIEFKKDSSPLTLADTASHESIREFLSRNYPDIRLLSEEGRDIPFEVRRGWHRYFCVDPLDGTKEFIKRNGEFTVNIALIEGHKARFGVIYAPVQDRLYFGGSEYGAYRMEGALDSGREPGFQYIFQRARKLPLKEKRPSGVIVAVGSRSHMNDETRAYFDCLRAHHGAIEILSAGSSLKLCLVAEGTAHVYPRLAPTMEWDTAAGQAIVEGAGGTIKLQNGAALGYNKPELVNRPFTAWAFSTTAG